MTELNLYTWFAQRELNYCPQHFVVVDIMVTVTNKQWVLEKLTGRFCLVETPNYDDAYNDDKLPFRFGFLFAFEDPKEASYFSLVWS